ncbi:MAG: helix-turn-helix transcriptional regulator [Cyclobacteriaceae bacterium]
MKGTNLGEFEELVLLIVVAIPDDAYSVSIADTIKDKTGRKPAHSVVHTALYRMEEKGFVKSEMGEATAERGGRRKRMYKITAAGMKALEVSKAHRDTFWDMIPATRIADVYESK